MKSLLNYTNEKKEEILILAPRRKLYYQIHCQVSKLARWTKAVYCPLHTVDRQSLLIFAQSVIDATTQIQNLARNLINILEEDNASQKEKV